MSVVSDAQASHAGKESRRHLSVLGGAAALTVAAGLVACRRARRATRSLREL